MKAYDHEADEMIFTIDVSCTSTATTITVIIDVLLLTFHIKIINERRFIHHH